MEIGSIIIMAIIAIFVEPAVIATVNIQSMIMGSTRIETIISLLLPSPPKAVPASRAASAKKNLPSASM